MNNYIRYYGQENPQISNSWHSVTSPSNPSWFTPKQENEEELYEDEKDRRVIYRESLFENPDLFYSEEPEESPPSPVGPKTWLKAGEGSSEAGPSARRPPAGGLPRSLAVALAQPAKMCKAQSMMEKMGWRGGALGKTGEGIVEPITPNAVYATKTRGFGQAVEKPPRKRPKPVFKEYNMEYFNTNTLLHLLEFVRNDQEIEVVFDPRLFKYERKAIHNLVNDVASSQNSVTNFDTITQMDIVRNIHRCNNYVLCTQSEGETPNRMLCIYKEAPEHVYLVTPNDLKEESPPNDVTDNTEDSAKDTEKKQDHNDINHIKKQDSNDRKVTENDAHAVTQPDGKVKQPDGKVKQPDGKVKQPDAKVKQPVGKAKQCDGKVKKHDGKVKQHGKGKQQNAKVTQNDVKITHNDVKIEQNDVIVEQNDVKVDQYDVKVEEKGETVKMAVEEDENPFLKSITRILKTNTKESEEGISKEFEKDCKINNAAKDMLDKVIKYFAEFADGEIYTEFRFLGPFDSEVIDGINEFIHNVHYCIVNRSCYYKKYEIVLQCVVKDDYLFEIREDCNGSPVIYKSRKGSCQP